MSRSGTAGFRSLVARMVVAKPVSAGRQAKLRATHDCPDYGQVVSIMADTASLCPGSTGHYCKIYELRVDW